MAVVIRTAKVFRNGGSQAIRLPKDMRVCGDEVVVRQDFDIITILPMRLRKSTLLALLDSIGPIELGPRNPRACSDRRADPVLRAPRRRARGSKAR